LTDLGYTVEVVDASDRSGGLIETITTPDGLVERAANACRWTPVTQKWFKTLGIVPAFPLTISRRRYIFRDGRPRRWPLGVRETVRMAVRAGAYYLGGRRADRQDELLSAWSDRSLGRAATEWLVSPAFQGVYGVSADRLSARVIRRERPERKRGPRLAAPRGGMGELVGALTDGLRARRATLRLDMHVSGLDPDVSTVVCTDADSASKLVVPHAPGLAATLRSIEMQAVWSATAFFEPAGSDLHGFGMLFPRPSGVRALGMLINTDIFAGRGRLRSETWIYDEVSPSPETACGWIVEDRERVTGRHEIPCRVVCSARKTRLPVYGPPVLRMSEAVHDTPPWLTLAGNYLGDIGVADLLAGAEAAACRVARVPRSI
jgi:oxygen-dependent protoporphyrinogen oxidase